MKNILDLYGVTFNFKSQDGGHFDLFYDVEMDHMEMNLDNRTLSDAEKDLCFKENTKHFIYFIDRVLTCIKAILNEELPESGKKFKIINLDIDEEIKKHSKNEKQ